ncbi:MAG: hypothetical protein WA902_03500 [Thermosynechococcaceae cyanobacterium]
MFESTILSNTVDAVGYLASRPPGEYVSYYRFSASSQEIEKVLNQLEFERTQHRSTPKFAKMSQQPDWWDIAESIDTAVYSAKIPSAFVESKSKRWLIYNPKSNVAYLYSSSGEFGIQE